MKLIKNPIKIIENTLNYVDPRLMDHGKRVAYLLYKTLKSEGVSDEAQLKDAILIALLHDIGAYKTEEISNLVQFEIDQVWEHSVYGYLFLKYFSPLKAQAPAILFHHADCLEITHLAQNQRKMVQMLHVADRLDVLSQTTRTAPEALGEHFERMRDIKFAGDVLDIFFKEGCTASFDDIEEDAEFVDLLYNQEINDDEVLAFIKMLVLSIDFRSPQTVGHTFMLVGAAETMAGLLGYSRRDRERVVLASLLHDLGKIGVATEILEKPGALTEDEMKTMRKHIDMTEDILEGNVDEIVCLMAVRHHERMNGSGYPRGLTAEQLTPWERLIAVADIFSALCGRRSYKEPFPKEKVVGIMEGMSRERLIDPRQTALAIDHYDDILRGLNARVDPILRAYDSLSSEYSDFMARVKTFSSTSRHAKV